MRTMKFACTVSLLAVVSIAALAHGESTGLEARIPGTDSPISVLSDAVEWQFLVEGEDEPESLSLGRSGSSVLADEAITYRFRSVHPYGDKGPDGYTYLRFELRTFLFRDLDSASAALEEILPRAESGPFRDVCFGGGYWVQIDARVYNLSVPCLFSDANYKLIVDALLGALSIGDLEPIRSIRCICGGGWEKYQREIEN